jgi:hypothetical protein
LFANLDAEGGRNLAGSIDGNCAGSINQPRAPVINAGNHRDAAPRKEEKMHPRPSHWGLCALMTFASAAGAAEIEVKMLDKGTEA